MALIRTICATRLRSPTQIAVARRLSTPLRASSTSSRDDLSRLSEPGNAVGWGATRMADLLAEKGPDSGAWLWMGKDELVIDAVRKMTEANAGSLLVFDPDKLRRKDNEGRILLADKQAVVGIFTERDYMTKIAVKGRSSRDTRMGEVMTPNPVTVSPHHSVLDVMELMIRKNFRHVPIVDDGRLLGMASMRDVVHIMLKEHREEVERLQEYIQGTI